MNYLIPPINSKGKFKLVDEIASYLDPTFTYQVTSIRNIQDLIDEGTDVYNGIYVPLGLSNDAYLEDLENNVPIVTLQDEAGTYFYIPANRFVSIPDITGNKLVDRVIAIDLGFVPVNEDLSYLIPEIVDLIREYTGLDPTGKILDTSKTIVLNDTEFNTYRQKRETVVTKNETCRGKVAKLEQILEAMKEKEKILVDRLVKLEGNG